METDCLMFNNGLPIHISRSVKQVFDSLLKIERRFKQLFVPCRFNWVPKQSDL